MDSTAVADAYQPVAGGYAPGQDAAMYPVAADVADGTQVTSDAPNGEVAPDEETTDWQSLLADANSRAEQAEQQRRALEAQQQQLLWQAGQLAWQQEAAQAHQHAANLDFDQAQAYLANFYQGREQRLMAVAQQATQAVTVNSFANDVIARHGLEPDDRVLLGNDPQQMPAIAAKIAADRQKTSTQISALTKEMQQLRRAVQATQALGNPAYRQGGARPNGGPPVQVVPGSLDHLAQLLGM